MPSTIRAESRICQYRGDMEGLLASWLRSVPQSWESSEFTAFACPEISLTRVQGRVGHRTAVVFPFLAETVTLDPVLEKIVRQAITVENQFNRIVEFFKAGIPRIDAVEEAFVVPTSDGVDLWVLVDGPVMPSQRKVVKQVIEAMDRFKGLSVDFLVLPISARGEIELPKDAVPLVRG